MALQLRFVDEIHKRLLVRYGSQWVRLWDGVPSEDVKADWSEQLSSVTPEGVRHALANLPDDYPPNVAQFRALCGAGRQVEPLRLPPPDPEGLKRVAEVLGEVVTKAETVADKSARVLANLRDLRDRGTMTAGQRDFLRRVEESGASDPAWSGAFSVIDTSALPPGMREAA